MAYQHGTTPQPENTMLTIEQARRRNAELRRELAALMFEQADLAPKVEAMRQEVTAARKKLTRQIKDLDAVRIQSANIAAMASQAPGTEPVYGGPEGLKAAAEEMRAHEKGEAILAPDEGGRCGTRRKYGNGCRCTECRGWRERKSARELVLKAQRMERKVAEALQAAEVAA